MRKKLIIVFIVLGILSVPFVGNQVIKDTIKQRISQLKQDGLDVRQIQEKKGYLKTKLFYKVTVQDEKKFIKYLQQYSSKQLPPYTKSLLSGVEFGIDIAYNNIPLSDKIDIDIYPSKFPDKITKFLLQNNPKFYAQLEKLLQEKKILYHIVYGVTDAEFHGFMKDLNEHFTQKGGDKISFLYDDVVLHGKGMILAPENLKVSVGKFIVNVQARTGDLKFNVKGLHSSANFETDTTYITSLKIDSLLFCVKDHNKKIIIKTDVKGIMADLSSNTQNVDAEVFTKGVIRSLAFDNNQKKYHFEDLYYNVEVDGLNKKSYIKLKKMLEKEQNFKKHDDAVQKEILNLLSGGLNIKVAKFTLKKFTYKTKKDLGGFDITLLLHVNKDTAFLKKIKKDPKVLVKNITAHSDMKFDVKFYNYLNTLYSLDKIFGKYKKQQKGQIVFDVDFIDQVFYINKQKFQNNKK